MAKSWQGHQAYPVQLDQALDAWCTTTQTWYLKPWIPYGAITLLVAQAKTGKTTWLMNMLAAQHHGMPFLGQTLPKVRTLYVTEQSPAVFQLQAINEGIRFQSADIDLMARYRFLTLSWANLCELLLEHCTRWQIWILIIDTWSGIAGFSAEMENDSAEARRRLEQLGPILALGTAVAIAAHQGHKRLAGKPTPIAAARGSSGLGDGVDQAIWLQRAKGAPGSHRTLWAEGRFVETPTDPVEIQRVAHQGPPIGGVPGVPTPPKWLYVNGLPTVPGVSAMGGGVTPVQNIPNPIGFTFDQLKAIWQCSGRTVRRRLNGIPGVQRMQPPVGGAWRYIVPT